MCKLLIYLTIQRMSEWVVIKDQVNTDLFVLLLLVLCIIWLLLVYRRLVYSLKMNPLAYVRIIMLMTTLIKSTLRMTLIATLRHLLKERDQLSNGLSTTKCINTNNCIPMFFKIALCDTATFKSVIWNRVWLINPNNEINNHIASYHLLKRNE